MATVERICYCGPALADKPGSAHKRTCPYWRPPIQVPIRDERGQRLVPEPSRGSFDRRPRGAEIDAVQEIMGTIRKAFDELEHARVHMHTLEDELRSAQLALGHLRDDLRDTSDDSVPR